MGLISFIKNLFKQKEDNLWVEQKDNSKSSDAKYDIYNDDINYNETIEINTLTGEVIIKRSTNENYPHDWYSGKINEIWET
jgi:hypothetical protein